MTDALPPRPLRRTGAHCAVFAALALAAAAACALAAPAAQAQTPAGPAADTAETGDLLIYEPDFFAASNPNTALDMVNRVPGFSLDNGDNVRGFAGSAGNVLVNGEHPASKSDSPSNVLSRTPASRVVRIELIRGGAPGIDMQGHTEVANVVLSDEASSQHTVTAETLIFEGGPSIYGGGYEYSASEGEREWSARLRRGINFNDGSGFGRLTRTDASGATLLIEEMETGFDGGGWNVGADWSGPVGPGSAEITASGWDGYFENLNFFVSPAEARVFDSRSDNRNGDVGLRYQLPLGETLTLTGRLIQEMSWSDGFSGSSTDAGRQVFAFDNMSGESIGRLSARWERSSDLTLTGAAEAAYNFLDTRQSFSRNGAEVPLPAASTKVEELRGELSGGAAWNANADLTLEGEVRLEASRISQSGDAANRRSFFYPKPRLSATWTPIQDNQFRFRFERELGQLDFGDFAASSSLANDQLFGGNTDLRPQQRWVTELVYERRFWTDGALTVTLRHDEIVDVIDTIPLPGGLSAVGNIGDGSLDRLRVNLLLPLDRLGLPNARLDIGGVVNRTSVTDPTTGRERRISGEFPFNGTIEFEQDIPAWDLTWGFFTIPYRRQPRFTPDQKTAFTVRNYFQVFAEYTISEGFTVRAEAMRWDDFRFERDVYADRQTQALDFTERRKVDPREYLRLRVRRQF